MNLKFHVFVVGLIVVTLLLIWQLFIIQPAVTEKIIISKYGLEIVRASYALECKGYKTFELMPSEDPYEGKKEDKIKENNVLSVISKLCNGKPACEFQVTPEVMGFDPAPSCPMKDLSVEFRCYRVDRMRKMFFMANNQAVIDCNVLAE